jgi:hypothetical protein
LGLVSIDREAYRALYHADRAEEDRYGQKTAAHRLKKASKANASISAKLGTSLGLISARSAVTHRYEEKKEAKKTP